MAVRLSDLMVIFAHVHEGVGFRLHCQRCDHEDWVDGTLREVVALPDGTRLPMPSGPHLSDPEIRDEFFQNLMGAEATRFREQWRVTWKSTCICLSCGEIGLYGLEGMRNVGFLTRAKRADDRLPDAPEERWRVLSHFAPGAVRRVPYFHCLSCKRPALLSLSGLASWILGPLTFVVLFCAWDREVRFPLPVACPRCGNRRRRVEPEVYIV